MTEPVQLDGVGGAAVFSPDGLHRYRLDRWWGDGEIDSMRRLLFVMQNPSVAGAHEDDQTIRKCVGFARRAGYERMTVVNLFSLIATDPADLAAATNRIDAFSDGFLSSAAAGAERAVLAWGVPPRSIEEEHRFRVARALGALCRFPDSPALPFWCLGKTAAGHPRHPSRLPYSTLMEEYR